MSHDPLRFRAVAADRHLQHRIRLAVKDVDTAKDRLALLRELADQLNLGAIVDALPEPEKPEPEEAP